jgi:hypothetical protein
MFFTFIKVVLLAFIMQVSHVIVPPSPAPNDIVKVIISQITTDGDLELIKSNLKYRNILFEYATLRNKKGEMEHILFIVDCKDGYDGGFSLVFDKKNKNNKVGFVRNYTKQGKAFVMGDVSKYENSMPE